MKPFFEIDNNKRRKNSNNGKMSVFFEAINLK